MLVFVIIVHICIKKKLYSLSRQGEACWDKIDPGKTLRSISLRRVRLFALLVNSILDFRKKFEIFR